MVSHATFTWWLSLSKSLKDRLIPSRDKDGQAILQSDWKRGPSGHTQPKKVISDAAFPWPKTHVIPCREIYNKKILQSAWTRGFNWQTQPKEVVPDTNFLWWRHTKNLRDYSISFRNIDDRRILQTDWMRGTTGPTQSKVAVPDVTFLWWLSPCKKSKRLIDSFQRHWWSKNPDIWLDKRHNSPYPIKIDSLRYYVALMINFMQKS